MIPSGAGGRRLPADLMDVGEGVAHLVVDVVLVRGPIPGHDDLIRGRIVGASQGIHLIVVLRVRLLVEPDGDS